MDVYEMAHRWCNCNFGKNGGWRNSKAHVSCDKTYFYSYSTVYAMWLDKTEGQQLMAIMDKGCSMTSNKHLGAIQSAIPKGIKVISTSLYGGWYDYRNVNFSESEWGKRLPYRLLEEVVEMVESFKDSRTIGTRGLLGSIEKRTDEINWLFENRKECKIGEFNKYMGVRKKIGMKKLFSFIRKKLSSEEIIEAFCGNGTLEAYYGRIKPQLKAERTRKFVEWFNWTHRTSPHGGYTMKEIKKMPIAEKVMLACYPPMPEWKRKKLSYHYETVRDYKLAKYLLGDDKTLRCCNGEAGSTLITNRFTGEKYEFPETFCGYPYWDLNGDCRDFARQLQYTNMGYIQPSLDLREYKKLQNKDQWLKRFYQKCNIISKRKKALRKWMEMQLYNDDRLNQCTEEEFAQYNRIQLMFTEFMVDVEARKAAEARERAYLEAEKARLEEERKLKYNDYVSRGIEGHRALYYEKLSGISVSDSFGSEFFFGGNVLLRWRTDEIIETSRNIYLTIEQAKKIYRQVSVWHNDPTKFKGGILETRSGKYNAQSYENDILTAGCHQVAWCEMDRMYNEIIKREIA